MKFFRVLLLLVVFFKLEKNSEAANIPLDQPLSALSVALSCDTVYRISMPLRGQDHKLTLVFCFPSHRSLREVGIRNTSERAVELSKLLYSEENAGHQTDAGALHLEGDVFNKLLSALATSEVFSLATEKSARYDDYLLVTVIGEEMVVAERYAAGENKIVKRVYGESVATTYVANQFASILGKVTGKIWIAGQAESDKTDGSP
jgi:hypothetical protein